MNSIPEGAGQAEATDRVRDLVLSSLSEILGQDSISPDDNFFAIGGDSLSAVELMERVESELGIDFPLAELFESNSIREFVAVCAGQVG